MASTNGFIYALQESHLPGIIICAFLLVISAFSWTVMVSKFLTVNRARRQTRLFLDRFRRSRTPLDTYCDDETFDGSPIYSIYLAGSRELTFQLLGSSQVDATLGARLQRTGKLSGSQMDNVAGAMDRAVGEVALRLEGQMTLLATVVSGAPFLGLLGTVWGVMETFSGIASAGAGSGASIQSMAPGVSAALVTTVIGLLVAIPAMFGYNFLITSIRAMVVRMDNFAAEMTSAVHRYYADHAHRTAPLPDPDRTGAAAVSDKPERGPRREPSAASSRPASAKSLRDEKSGESTGSLPGFDAEEEAETGEAATTPEPRTNPVASGT